MGSLISPRPPSFTPAPVATAVASPPASVPAPAPVAATPVTATPAASVVAAPTEPPPVAEQEAAVARRARGRSGTVATGWTGALLQAVGVPDRKRLLGE